MMDMETDATSLALARANAKLTVSLLLHLADRQPTENIFVSPVSIALALSVLALGADSESRRLLEQGLGVSGLSRQDADAALGTMASRLETGGARPPFQFANALWMNEDAPLNPAYQALARHILRAEAKALDLTAPASINAINKWTNAATRGRIPQMLDHGQLTSQTCAVLTSAAHFAAEWACPFEISDTRPGKFTDATDTRRIVPMMSRRGRITSFSDDRMQAFALPYQGGRFQWCCFLPERKRGMEGFLDNLSHGTWIESVMSMDSDGQASEIELEMPRFTISCDATLKPWLDDAGLGRLLKPSDDFAMMGIDGVWLEEVRHKTYLLVDELKTEAAAITDVEMNLCSHPELSRIVLDRPFVCAIVDTITGLTLFAGIVNAPEAA